MSLSGWLKDYLYIPMGGNRSASWFTAISAGFLLCFVVLLSPTVTTLAVLLATLLGGAVAMARIPRFNRWVITNVNIWMTMLLGGLWHGASWNFVIWGGLNGLGITVYKLWRKVSVGDQGPVLETGDRRADHHSSPSPASGSTASHTTWASFGSEHDLGAEWDAANQVLRTVGTATSPAVVADVLSHYGHVFAVMGLGYAIHLLPSRWKQAYRAAFTQAGWGVQVACATAAVLVAMAVLSAGGTPFIYFQF